MIRSTGLYGSGVVRMILAPTVFTFDNYTAAQTLIVAEHIDIGTLVEPSFVTRFHSASIAGTGTISVVFKIQGFTLEDPTTPFIPSVLGLIAPTTTVDGKTNLAPFLGLSSASANAGPQAAVEIVGTANGTCSATISIDLIAKGGTSFGNAEGYSSLLGFAG